MGSKQKITQVSTLTPEQSDQLSARIKANRLMAMNLILGQGYGGPNSTTPVNAGTGQSVSAPTASPANPLFKAIASAAPGAVGNDPFGLAAYSNRNALVNPIVNPFRRNLGG